MHRIVNIRKKSSCIVVAIIWVVGVATTTYGRVIELILL
jgi:hypothetical protein